MFEITGDYPAPSFFEIGRTSGEIAIRNDLKTDNLKSTDYIVRVIAYDTSYPDQVSTVTVPIQVTRNERAPIFSQPEYRTSIAENHRLGSSVLQLIATDDDNVSVGSGVVTMVTMVTVIGNSDQYSSPPVIRTPLLPNNSILIREVFFGKTEKEEITHIHATGC